MPGQPISLDAAVDLTRTGDVWLFRGHSAADRTIQLVSNAPVNHVGMTVVIDDLPALLWHAELGRSLPDMWTGERQRGVQLHELRDAVRVWTDRYGQRAWLRQLEPAVTGDMEGAVLRTVARLDGMPFPSTASSRPAGSAARSRYASVPRRRRKRPTAPRSGHDLPGDGPAPRPGPTERLRPRKLLERRQAEARAGLLARH